MRKVTLSPTSWMYLLLFVFVMIVILIGVRWTLSVVLIYISLMTNGVQHFFIFIGDLYFFF
jgi:hypothetical protein